MYRSVRRNTYICLAFTLLRVCRYWPLCIVEAYQRLSTKLRANPHVRLRLRSVSHVHDFHHIVPKPLLAATITGLCRSLIRTKAE